MKLNHPFDLVIGLDRSDRKADLYLIETATGNTSKQTIAPSPEALHDWLAQLRQRYPNSRVALCLEQPAVNLILFLETYAWLTLYAINPITLQKFRETFVTSRAKDDSMDCRFLAELLLTHLDKLKPWRPDDCPTRQLQQLHPLDFGLVVQSKLSLDSNALCQFSTARSEHFLVQRFSVRIHCHHGWKSGHFKLPDRLRRSEFFHHINIANALNSLRQHLCCAANRVQIDAAVFSASIQCLRSHSAFADNTSQAEVTDDLPLIRFLANGSCRSRSHAFPFSLFILDNNRTTVIQNAILELHFCGKLATVMQILVDSVASGK